MTSSLKKLAIRGSAWTIIGYGTSQTFRFAGNLILTRLLAPEYFGIMAIVNTIRMGLELLSDIGITQNVVRSERGDEQAFLNTAWTISLIRGLGLWFVLLLLSWPISRFYENPVMFPALVAIGLVSPLRGAVSPQLYTLNRHMMLGKMTLLDLSTQVIALSTMVILSLFYPSIWALIIGDLVGQTYRTVMSYFIGPQDKHYLCLEKKAKEEIIGFGRWIFVSSVVLFLSEQSDRLILGKLIPLDILGVYSIAYVLANLPVKITRQMGFKVIFPLVSKQIHLPRKELKQKLNKNRWKLHLVLLSILAFLAGLGDLLIEFLYDSRYEQAAWMLPILALGAWFSALFFVASPCILALGKPVYNAKSRVFRLFLVAFGLPIGFKLAGIFGSILVVSLGDLPAYIVIQYHLMKEGIGSLKQDISASFILIGMILVIYTIRELMGVGRIFDSVFINVN
ncbi:oligosaccharide flippase family protein [Crocosphaera sp. Alani8]|uniref:oligosaccharide flippase family protein n=1 Tax=Crocosphaera sp. Alani8 TaxID=3038952 RepID=UPI00313CA517